MGVRRRGELKYRAEVRRQKNASNYVPECIILAPPLSLLATSPLTVFIKHGQLDFSKASDSISD